jgi:hypothetical protein
MATSKAAALYQDYTIPKQFLGKTVPFIVVGDVKYVSGGGARIEAYPLDSYGNIQGIGSSSYNCSGRTDWQLAVGGFGWTDTNATKIRIAMKPDMPGSNGEALFDSVSVYFGHTPWHK